MRGEYNLCAYPAFRKGSGCSWAIGCFLIGKNIEGRDPPDPPLKRGAMMYQALSTIAAGESLPANW